MNFNKRGLGKTPKPRTDQTLPKVLIGAISSKNWGGGCSQNKIQFPPRPHPPLRKKKCSIFLFSCWHLNNKKKKTLCKASVKWKQSKRLAASPKMMVEVLTMIFFLRGCTLVALRQKLEGEEERRRKKKRRRRRRRKRRKRRSSFDRTDRRDGIMKQSKLKRRRRGRKSGFWGGGGGEGVGR